MNNTSSISNEYAKVVLPFAVPKVYTYKIPSTFLRELQWGIRVEVPLRNKVYSGIIVGLTETLEEDGFKPKDIISVIDKIPVITKDQYTMWTWMANYYCCTIGEVMNVALPSGLKLQSETKIVFNGTDEIPVDLDDDAYIVAEALQIHQELTINEVRVLLDKKTIFPVIYRLLDRGILLVQEELVNKFKVKKENFVQLTESYLIDKSTLHQALDLTKKSKKQTDALLGFVELAVDNKPVHCPSLYKLADINKAVINAMVKKGIFTIIEKEVSRINRDYELDDEVPPLSEEQIQANVIVKQAFEDKKPVLLHGVTGSGKTRIYIEWIMKAIEEGGQCLFLLPEIALTTQIVGRLRKVFGDDIGVYHSRMSRNDRVELWKASLLNNKKIVLGARSSMFLPFKNLKLIIVDEEHDGSYKQYDPSPRYNGRDVAVYMSHLYKANIILGSATPSLESYHNASLDKYALVEMHQRYGNSLLPSTTVIDLGIAMKKKQVRNHFSNQLIDKIQTELDNNNQVLIFQNRRGFTSMLSCNLCGWVSECKYCDVSLTYHKFSDEQRCHYCGYREKPPKTCPSCQSPEIVQKGLGTEKIEQDVTEFFPFAKVARLDYDTAKSKSSFESILFEFENQNIDILIGTQMITKGLDFDNVSLVVILNADLILRFPDFRANERAMQLFTQVSGRAGRRETQGEVYIQTYSPDNIILKDTINLNYEGFFKREMQERKEFFYPPFYRLIHITTKHKNAYTNIDAARIYTEFIQEKLGNRVLGPATPGISRLRGMFLQGIVVKLEKDPKTIQYVKRILMEAKNHVKSLPGLKTLRINIDVDPY